MEPETGRLNNRNNSRIQNYVDYVEAKHVSELHVIVNICIKSKLIVIGNHRYINTIILPFP